MGKIFELKLYSMSRRYANTPAERREWIALNLRNEAKRLAAIAHLGSRWILYEPVRKTPNREADAVSR